MTQHGRMSGTFTAGGRDVRRHAGRAGGACATTRGASAPLAAASRPQRRPPNAGLGGFYWQWSPVQFDDVCLMYTVQRGRRRHALALGGGAAVSARRPAAMPQPLTVVVARPQAQARHAPVRARHACSCTTADGAPVSIRHGAEDDAVHVRRRLRLPRRLAPRPVPRRRSPSRPRRGT